MTNYLRTLAILSLILVLSFSIGFSKTKSGAAIKVGLSGAGAVNDSTVKAGEDFNLDIYCENDSVRTGFTFGFSFTSDDIKKIVHVTDSGNGTNEDGDILGHNGWEDKSIWDFGGLFTVPIDWDGNMPEQIGFGGLSIKKEFGPSEMLKIISIKLNISETGTIVVDSAYYPPGGKWMMSSPPEVAGPVSPDWSGPFKFKVVK